MRHRFSTCWFFNNCMLQLSAISFGLGCVVVSGVSLACLELEAPG
jgi:hypothetical protein